MAVVDVAYREETGPTRLVAFKRLASRFVNDVRVRKLFLREASILLRLEHPNLVRTYEIGETEGEAFIAMELLEGATLAQLLHGSSAGVSLPIALRIARDALRGLHEAHELKTPDGEALGLVHQDVSPQNIHVAYEGTTRILDFGIARVAAADASRTGSVFGKPCYLSPEQLTLASVDRRADVFALGVVLYELVTGKELFPRTSIEAAYAAILEGKTHSPRAVAPSVPEEIDAVVRRALAREPSDRFSSADEMRVALARAQERAGVPEADLDAVGALVTEAAPREWTRAELVRELREIHAGGVTSAPLVAPARDLDGRWSGGTTRTLPPESADLHALPTLGKRRRRRGSVWLGIALGAAPAVLLGALAGRAAVHRSNAAPSPSPVVSVVREPVAPSEIAPPVASSSGAPAVVAEARPLPTAAVPARSPSAPRAKSSPRAVPGPAPSASAATPDSDDVYQHM
jgi:hypothetical protein